MTCVRRCSSRDIVCWHQIGAEAACVGGDGLKVRSPLLELLLSIGQDLSCLVGVGKRLTNIARYDRRVVEQVQEASTISGEDYLLLGTFNGGREVQIICFFNFLTSLERSAHCLKLAMDRLTILVSCASATRF